jgi:2-oxoglutarate ferredoxin oxidoreductase subunit alpha
VIIAAATPADCFDYAYIASKIAIEHMTPVILLTDGYLANGSELWHIPDINDMPDIKVPAVKDNDPDYQPYFRDPETLARSWAMPGQEGLRHKVGGLEKEDVTGEVSHDPLNHQVMIELRHAKVEKVVDYIPEQTIVGKTDAELLVIGWGGTYGPLLTAVEELQDEGYSISLAQFNYIRPLPKNTADVLKACKKRIVCEQNLGQFADYLTMKHPQFEYLRFNKVQGLPFMISELKAKFKELLEEK